MSEEPAPSSHSGSTEHGVGRRFRKEAKLRIPVPASLQRICEKALASTADQRYLSARSLADDLDQWMLQNRIRASSRRRFAVPALLGMSVMLIACGGLVVAFSPIRLGYREPQSQAQSSENALVSSVESLAKIPLPMTVPPKVKDVTPGKTHTPLPKAPVLPIVGNFDKKIYHRVNSPCVKLMNQQNRVSFKTTVNAADDGYRACEKCFHD
jgi:hypothetical protein